MASVLLLYASREGQTRKVATRIASHLESSGLAVNLVDAADVAAVASIDPDADSLLIFGASLHVGGLERELTRYINANAQPIEKHARSFFLVSLSAATRDSAQREASLNEAREDVNRQISVAFDDITGLRIHRLGAGGTLCSPVV